MKNYFMGIDNGGSMCKVVIFDAVGAEIASSSVKLKMITTQAGYSERDMDELWQENCRLIRETIAKAGINAGEITGIACTGHGKGLYLWGKDDKPCCNGIISTDSRAWMYPEKWNADGTADRVFEKTCQKILACQPVSLLCWLKDHKPEIISNIKWIFEVKDYIRFKLTDQAFAELTDYSGSNLLNLRDEKFDRSLMAEFGLEDLYEALPPLKKSTDFCGGVSKGASEETGLKEGTPLAGGMFDIDACGIAMGIVNEDYVCVIGGTWGVNQYISRQPVVNRSVMLNSLYCIPGYYLIEECSPTSASNFDWFLDMFLAEEKAKAKELNTEVYRYCDALAATVAPDEQNIIFLPYIFGSNYNPQAKASLIGLDNHHTRSQIIRAVLEGIVFCHKIHLEKLVANRAKTDAIRLGGGVANSLIWAQIFADVFRLPVEIIEIKEIGTLGCAMAAAVAAGVYQDLPEAAQNMVKVKCRIEPFPANIPVYENKLALYKKVSAALEPLWQKFQ